MLLAYLGKYKYYRVLTMNQIRFKNVLGLCLPAFVVLATGQPCFADALKKSVNTQKTVCQESGVSEKN